MYFHRNLLSKHCNIQGSAQEIATSLTHKTCEVEHIKIRDIPDGVVIGYVVQCSKHPDADTLAVCQVDCGSHGMFQILTGGTNIGVDMYVAVALPGCYLPCIDMTISARTMRGLESRGMICSKGELGIWEDEEQHRIWILQRERANTGDVDKLDLEGLGDMSDLTRQDCGVGLASKYPWLNNWILEVDNKTLTHRPDLTGHRGLAQEITVIQDIDSSNLV